MKNNEKKSDILNWINESAPIKSTNIKTDNSSNEVNSKTTKPIITTKVVENNKCYYPGCDETNYLTDENCINYYENKPSSNECPNGFKYKDGLCYGSSIN